MRASHIGRITQAGRESARVERGANTIPAMWRGTVLMVREVASEAGSPAGVYVRVPRLTGDEIHGPLQWVGAQPAEGDRVLIAAVEGRRDQLIIISPPAGVTDGLLDRVAGVEDQTAENAGRLTSVESTVSDQGGTLAGVVDDVAENVAGVNTLDGRVGSLENAEVPLATPSSPGLMSGADKVTLDALPGIEVDISVGALVFVGGVPVHYDSGWRDISDLLVSDITPGSYVHVRRTLNEVHVRAEITLESSKNNASLFVIPNTPNGWRPAIGGSAGSSGTSVTTARHNNSMFFVRVNPYGSFDLQGSLNNGVWDESPVSGDSIIIHAILQAEQGVPGSFVGTPA